MGSARDAPQTRDRLGLLEACDAGHTLPQVQGDGFRGFGRPGPTRGKPRTEAGSSPSDETAAFLRGAGVDGPPVPASWSPQGDLPSREPPILSGCVFSSADRAGVAHGGQLLKEGGPHFSAPQRLWGSVVAQQEGCGLALRGAQERPERGQLREEEEESRAQRTEPRGRSRTALHRGPAAPAGSRSPAEKAS